MTLRISEEPLESGTKLRVAGELSGSALSELETSFRNAEPPVTLDLQEVTTADEQGLIMLRSLAAAGATLSGASTYLSMRLSHRSGEDPKRRNNT